MSSEFSNISYKLQEKIAILRFQRPEVLNAMNAALWQEFEQALEQTEENDSVRVLIVTGEGRAFSSGADLKESGSRSEEEYRTYLEQLQLISRRLIELPKPTIAAVNGYALGSGFEVALACDLRYAASDAKLGAPEAKVVASATGGTFRLLYDLVGPGRAKEILFSARHYSGQEAFEMGLVNGCFESDQLLAKVTEIANGIADNSRLSIQLLKYGLHLAQEGADLEYVLKYEVDACMEAVTSEERKQALEEFAKRK